jgi:Ca-activated chloride channel family protein
MRFANFEALERVVQGRAVVPKNYFLLAMRMLVLVGFTLAASGVTFHYEMPGSYYDYVLAIDSSSSMLANDLTPDRITASTNAAADWLLALPPGASVSVASFSSQAEMLVPPTADTQSAAEAVRSLAVGKSGGTALCEALKASTNQLLASDNPGAAVIISDGQNNAGCLLEEGIAYANRHNVTVFSIGVGNRQGGRIEGFPDLLFKLNETDLQEMAAQTGGKYFRAETRKELADALAQVSVPGTMHKQMPLTVPLMIISFMFVFIDWGMSVTKYRTVP